mmetsp:Transcript_2781/g.4206  ORF Transcript_2781/g.4206 Transcript_2781/m.4206 type:complete len:523 (+) Transcript_2781:251-1819(+)
MKLLLNALGNSVSIIDDGRQNLGVSSLHVGKEGALEGLYVLHVDAITVSLNSDEKGSYNLLGLIRLVLSLLKQLVKTNSTIELLLGGGIQIRTELGEGSNLTVLGKLELHGTCNSLGGLVLRGGSYTGYGETYRNSRTLSLVEELGLKENLSISNGNNVSRNVSRYISSLCLNDGKGGEGSSSGATVHLSSTLKKTRVKVENISRVSLTSRGTTEKKRHLTVGNSLLGKIVVKDYGVLSVVTEVLSHGGSGVGGKKLKRSRVGSGGSNNDAVVHGLLLIKLSYELSNGGSLLSNSDVDTGKGLLLGLLVNNGINGDGSLSSLTISNNQLTLSTSNGDQGINGLESGKHRLGNGLPGNDTGGLYLSTGACAVVKGSSSIDGLTNSVNNTSKKLGSNGNVYDGSGTLDSVSLQNITIISEDNHSYVILLKVEGHTTKSAGEDNHFSGLYVGKTVNTGDTISYGNNRSSLGVLCAGVLRTGGSRDSSLEVGGKLKGLGSHATGSGGKGTTCNLGGGGKSRLPGDA